MSLAAGAALGIIFVLLFSWVVSFGGIGAVLSRAREGSLLEGFLWGAALGPVGWVCIWLRTRGARGELESSGDVWEAL